MTILPSQLKMQAYERLITLVQRMGFPSLSERLPAGTLTAKQLAAVYSETIISEFEHNISQQIYVSEEAWQSVSDLKNQQLFIIEQLVKTLPEAATAQTWLESINAFLHADPHASLQPLVLEAIKKEAKLVLSQL
jgi:hypothetical protein